MKKEYLVKSEEWYVQDSQAQAYLDLLNSSYGGGVVDGEISLLAQNQDWRQHCRSFFD